MSNKNFKVKNGLEVGDNFTVDASTGDLSLAQGVTITYDEADDRANRPSVQSSTGNTSGWRVAAPNATTSAVSNISAFSSNDADNGKFISIQARGATSNDIRIATGKYTAGVLGASGTVVSFVDNVTAYATVNPAGTTSSTDLTTKSYVDTAIANLVDTAPTTLDTLNELAAALGDDANFSTTVTTALGTKLATADFTSTADSWLGTKSTTNLAQGTNLYYTDALARAAHSATAPIGYNTTTGAITFTPTPTSGSLLAGNGTTWDNSILGISNQYNLNRNSTGATGANNILVLTKTRTDGARTNGQGPFEIFNYTGTDGGYNFARQSTGYQSGGAHTFSFATSTDTTGAFGAGTSTPLTFSKSSGTFTFESGFLLANRTGAVAAQVPAQVVRYSRTDVTGPTDSDGVDFRLGVGGTATNTNVARFDAVYKSSGLNEIGMSVSTDSFAADTDRIYVGTRESTRIRATPAGGGSVSDIMVVTDTAITNNRAHRNSITTGTVARGATYSVPALCAGSVSLTITAGTAATTYIDVDLVTGDPLTGGMYSILIYNNSGDNNIDVQIRNNATNIGLVNNMDIGNRAIASIYVVDGYAAAEIMDAA